VRRRWDRRRRISRKVVVVVVVVNKPADEKIAVLSFPLQVLWQQGP